MVDVCYDDVINTISKKTYCRARSLKSFFKFCVNNKCLTIKKERMKQCIFRKETNADKALVILFCLSIIIYVTGEIAYQFGQALAAG